MRVLKKYPKNTNFGQFPLSLCQKVTKKLQKARKIVIISKSLCHHLNLLSQKHLTPFFSESPISPRVHSRGPKILIFSPKMHFNPSCFQPLSPPIFVQFFAYLVSFFCITRRNINYRRQALRRFVSLGIHSFTRLPFMRDFTIAILSNQAKHSYICENPSRRRSPAARVRA